MNTIDIKIVVPVILFVFGFLMSSCKDEEVLLSISNSEAIKMEQPEIEITTTTNSAKIEVSFAKPFVVGSADIEYRLKSKGGFSKATLISHSDTNYVWEINGLSYDTEYELQFDPGNYQRYVIDGILIEAVINWQEGFRTKAPQDIYSSPIAVKGGFDKGWSVISSGSDTDTWESVPDSGNQSYGGIGYAAAICNSTDWLISPAIYLEKGVKYVYRYYIKNSGYYYTYEPEVYITTTKSPEDNLLQKPTLSADDFKSSAYRLKEIVFVPEKTDYYYCSFLASKNTNYVWMTGFEVLEY